MSVSPLDRAGAEPPASLRGLVAFPQFRAMFGAMSINNLVVWLHTVAAALLMTSMSSQPLMTALVQSAITLPAFLFSAHAGVLSDLVDRRRMILVTQAGMALASAFVLALSLGDVLTPAGLLLFTFMLGTASAVGMPTWITAAPDAVPASLRMHALGLNAVSYNAARAIGPALAGTLIAIGSADLVFAVTLVACSVVFAIVWRRYPAAPPAAAGTESVTSALRTGLRYSRHSPPIITSFGRTIGFVVGASALWALLPLVARNVAPGSTSAAYGWMLGSMGAGAVVAGLMLGRMRARIPLVNLINGAAMVFAAATVVVAYVPLLAVQVVVLFLAGAGWVSSSATIMATVQSSLPLWVRARVLALQMLMFQGSMALGAVLWGAVGNVAGVPAALALSAAGILLAQLVTGRWPVRMGSERETTAAGALPEVPTAWAPPPDIGPVAVEIEYFVERTHEDRFVRQVHRIGQRRMRDGARHWRLYRDLSDRSRLMERFVVDSWDDYLRHRDRSTVADRLAEDELNGCLRAGTAPVVSHFINEPIRRPG